MSQKIVDLSQFVLRLQSIEDNDDWRAKGQKIAAELLEFCAFDSMKWGLLVRGPDRVDGFCPHDRPLSSATVEKLARAFVAAGYEVAVSDYNEVMALHRKAAGLLVSASPPSLPVALA